MKKVILISVLTLFSAGAIAGDIGDTTNGTATSVDVTNSQPVTVTVNNLPAENGTRGIDGPVQTESNIRYSGSYELENVPNVSAPALTTTMTETCMGSTSAGAGWVGFGFSFGTTWRDSACVRRLDARQLAALGYNLGAKELMCDSPAVAAALKRAGKPCYNDLPPQQKRPEDRKVVPVVGAAGGAEGEGW